MTGFVVAMKSEAMVLLEQFEHQCIERNPFEVYRVNVLDQQFILVISRVGKVNAATATQYLIDKFNPNFIVNYGIAGGVFGQTELGQIYAVDKCVQYDFDISEIDGVVGVIPNFDTPFFTCDLSLIPSMFALPVRSLATGDLFTSREEVCQYIDKHFGCQLRDMEGAAVAHACKLNNIPFCQIKGVSDFVGKDSVNLYEKFSLVALGQLGKMLKEFVPALCEKGK